MLTFKARQVPDFAYKEAIKKPIRIRCVQIHEAFMVETMEGTLKGKAGDWLMVGINGEMYPIDQEIFKKTYDLCD